VKNGQRWLASASLIAALTLPGSLAAQELMRVELVASPNPETREQLAELLPIVAELLKDQGQISTGKGRGGGGKAELIDRIELSVAHEFRAWRLRVRCQRSLSDGLAGEAESLCLFKEEIARGFAKLVCQARPALARIDLMAGSKLRVVPLVGSGRAFRRGTILALLRRRTGQRRARSLQLSFGFCDGRLGGSLVSGSGLKPRNQSVLYGSPIALDETPLRIRVVDKLRGRPLAGYRVYLKTAAKSRYVALTDGAGRASFRLSRPALAELEIHFNQLIVARVPIVPCRSRGELVLRMQRRPDASAIHRALSQALKEFDELLLIRQVALEDVAAAVAARRFRAASKSLGQLKRDMDRAHALERRVRQLQTKARTEGKDVDRAATRILKAMGKDAPRLETTNIERDLRKIQLKIAGRKTAEDRVLKANASLVRGDVTAAIARLEEAVKADPDWNLPREKLRQLKRGWKLHSTAHGNARRLVGSLSSLSWQELEGRLGSLRDAVTELERVADNLTLRVLSLSLSRRLSELNLEAEKRLLMKDLAIAKRLTSLTLKLQPLIDEIAGYLHNGR